MGPFVSYKEMKVYECATLHFEWETLLKIWRERERETKSILHKIRDSVREKEEEKRKKVLRYTVGVIDKIWHSEKTHRNSERERWGNGDGNKRKDR